MTTTYYVVGFAIDDAHRVALIRKNRPAWQAGRLNGVGGHVEPNETPREAMAREFYEETGVAVLAVDWHEFVRMTFPGAVIHFYRARITRAAMDAVVSTTDEHVQPWHIGGGWRGYNPVPNLLWLVPLAAYTADDYDLIHVRGTVAEAFDDNSRESITEPEWRIVTPNDDASWPCTVVDSDGLSLLETYNGTPVIRDRSLAETVVDALNASQATS